MTPPAKAYDDGVGRSLATRAILSPPWHGVNAFVRKKGITSAERVIGYSIVKPTYLAIAAVSVAICSSFLDGRHVLFEKYLRGLQPF